MPKDLERGGAYDLDQVRTLMRGVSRQAIDKRVQEGSSTGRAGPEQCAQLPNPTVQRGRERGRRS